MIPTPLGRTIPVGLITKHYPMLKTDGKVGNVPMYDERALEWVSDYAKTRVIQRYDCPILITGKRRTGKSTIGLKLADLVDIDFPVSHFCFRLSDFDSILHTNPYADPARGVWPQTALDEAGFDLFAQSWMDAMQRNLVKKFEVIGAKNQIIYLILPHRMLLNKAMREFMAELWLTTRIIGGERGLVEVREASENIWELSTWWKPKMAIEYTPLEGPKWDEYQARKIAFIDEVTKQASIPEAPGPFNRRESEAIRQRNWLIAQIRSQGEKVVQMTVDELAKALGVNPSMIYDACKKNRGP